MISLVVDTCTANLIISVCDANKVLSQIIQKNDANLSTEFTVLVQETIKKANITIDDIETIFVANGPGSFTGIRIGLTFAKVFAWSKKIKVIPFSSLELLASSGNTDYLVPMLNARRGYVYAGIYDKNLNSIFNDSYIKLEDLLKISEEYKAVSYISCDDCGIDTVEPNYSVIKIIEKHKNDPTINAHKLIPNYLKKTEAEEKLVVKND